MQKVIMHQKGYIHDRIPLDLYNLLINSLNIDDMASKPDLVKYLAGNLEIQKNITDLIPASFYEYLSHLANEYCNNFSTGGILIQETSDMKREFLFSNSWINYQKKYEFNPVHAHSGDLSYVIWIKIPYDLEKELQLANNTNSNTPCNSLFSFIGQDFEYLIKVSKEFEGEIIIFDSKQKHTVYPFYTSDDFRISLSGNIHVRNVA